MKANVQTKENICFQGTQQQAEKCQEKAHVVRNKWGSKTAENNEAGEQSERRETKKKGNDQRAHTDTEEKN